MFFFPPVFIWVWTQNLIAIILLWVPVTCIRGFCNRYNRQRPTQSSPWWLQRLRSVSQTPMCPRGAVFLFVGRFLINIFRVALRASRAPLLFLLQFWSFQTFSFFELVNFIIFQNLIKKFENIFVRLRTIQFCCRFSNFRIFERSGPP